MFAVFADKYFRIIIVVLAAVIAVVTAFSRAYGASLVRGRNLAQYYCAACHAVDKLSPSPLKIAPPFRSLHLLYPVESLEEALAEGITTGHPSMPQFRFDPDQVQDFIAFLKSLE